MSATYRIRWRADASGYVARYAGQWMGEPTTDRDWLADVVRAMANGGQVEIVGVPASVEGSAS